MEILMDDYPDVLYLNTQNMSSVMRREFNVFGKNRNLKVQAYFIIIIINYSINMIKWDMDCVITLYKVLNYNRLVYMLCCYTIMFKLPTLR